LGKPKILDQLPVALSFFNRVEVRTLEVLDKGKGQQLGVIDLAYYRGDVRPSEAGGCTKATLARDELEASSTASLADDYGLQESMHSKTRLQFSKIYRVERNARLERVRADVADWNPPLCFRARYGCVRWFYGWRKECVEAATKPARLVRAHSECS
jgi:hypothetical protein